MPLAAGTRLGPYEITAQIGVGGMGEVYRATDSKLGRAVAIKVLPEAVAADAERIARFEREARTLAALNHPNIAHLHGLEEAGGVRALVMELVEGPTLVDRIAHGALPFEEALAIARQIAEALEAAHEQGIVHRDLKPANIKVRDDGTVKVLDFGLAKVVESAGHTASSSTALSMSPTITTPAMTQMGMILGTAAYMSPEQAKGREADRRSDVWAFGAVLYEMLTGRRAFDGEDMVDTLGAVSRLDPDWTLLPETTPPAVKSLVQRCLEKDRTKRIGHMSAALFVLREMPSLATVPVRADAHRRLWMRAVPVLAGVILSAAGAAAIAWTLKPSPLLPVTRSRYALPQGQLFTNSNRHLVAISRDGTQLSYVANAQLFLRSLSELDARPVQGTEGGLVSGTTTPVFSPDGRSIVYWNGAIKRISTAGGVPVTLCESDAPWGMSWDESGVVYGMGPKGIMRVSPNGGMPEQIATVDGREVAAFPQMLPGGRALLFTVAATDGGRERWDTARVVVQMLDSGERKTLLEGGSNARYITTGHLLYAVSGVLFAVPFDIGRLELSGSGLPVVEGVRRSAGGLGLGAAQYDVSDNGTLTLVPGPIKTGQATQEIVRMDRKGGIEKLPLPLNPYGRLRVSPDGTKLAFDIDDGKESDVWVYELSGTSAPRRLTFAGANRYPIWSADGSHVVFQSDREGDLGIFWQPADGTGAAERLTTPAKGVAHVPESWSPKGDWFTFSVVEGADASLWVYSLKDKSVKRFSEATSTSPFNSEFSPDGRWVAYTLRGQGANIYVEPYPATGAKYQVTTVNGHHPVWLPDGTGISYRASGNDQLIATVKAGASFSIGNPVPAISSGLPTIAVAGARPYDFTHDGAAFLTVAPASGNQVDLVETQEIQIVTNWFEQLKRLAR